MFQDPPPGFTFTTLQSSSTLSFFTNSDDSAKRRIGRNMMPHVVKNYNEGLDQLQKGELDAFIYDSPFIDLGASKMPGCSFKVVGKPIITKAYAVAFPKNSQWRDPVTHLLLRYRMKDYFRKLQDKWFYRGGCLHAKGPSQSAYSEMKPGNFSGLFLICCGALATCFLILFVEYLWSRKERKAGKYTPNEIGQNNAVNPSVTDLELQLTPGAMRGENECDRNACRESCCIYSSILSYVVL
ncbi:Glutamate receptor ionotropic, NMDA 2B [Desmophyllum pertusum]|uniref:Glutamate receptor ionotropic, NMDA 2B n=1 Tax=Desmophyllum pertusum TaxID=174260 RepID=A0A9W9Z3X4_9CNID|nr:Glutamate receptor ionotropic, NMDA 2B [Desmophyllum pertusum]